MVKVFKSHNFTSQSIISTTGEPIAIYSFTDLILAANQNCSVEVFRFRRKPPHDKISTFYTEAPVLKILYSKIGNYISTIECKKARKQEYYAVKVYLNWELSTEKDKQRAKVRLAGKDRSLKSQDIASNSFQVIDVPCKYPVPGIATCQQTGNLAVIQRETTHLYHIVEKCIANSDQTYLDMVMFLELKWSFDIERISLCEDYVGVISREEAQVVKVLFFDKSKNSSDGECRSPLDPENFRYRMFRRKLSSVLSNQSPLRTEKNQSRNSAQSHSRLSQVGSSRNSSNSSPALSSSSLSKLGYSSFSTIKDDKHFVQWDFEDEDLKSDFDVLPGTSSRKQSKRSQKTILFKSLYELSNRDLLLADNPKIKDLRGGGHQTMGEIQVVTMLYKRQNGTNEEWTFLQLIPTYYSNVGAMSLSEMSTITPMHSTNYGGLVGVSCLLSSPATGYNYDVWMQTALLSKYKYTIEAVQIESDGALLYVLNEKGLEIFTCRSHSAVIPRIEDINDMTKAFPHVTMETCLCGIHPFIGGQQLMLADKFVTLLTKVDVSQRNDYIWNLYTLEKCSDEELYNDMIAFGCKHQVSSSSTYLHMLQEGLMSLRSNLIGQESIQSDLKELYKECCGLLGEHYSLPGCLEWKLCLPYYLMSELSVVEIVKKALQYKEQSKQSAPYCYGKGLLHYLNHVLFLDEEPLDIEEEDGDLILLVYSESLPDRLSEILLLSRLKSFTVEKALKYLQDFMLHATSLDEKQSALDLLALSCLHLRLCDPEPAQVALNATSPHDLVNICVRHHHLLHEEFTQLSPLSQLMRCHIPSVLIKSLVALLDSGMIPMDLAIKLLQGPNESGKLSTNTHVREYLEMLLMAVLEKKLKMLKIYDERTTDAGRHAMTIAHLSFAQMLLTSLYLERIQELSPPTNRQRHVHYNLYSKGCGHFGQRYSWLNDLPPFNGVASIKQPCAFMPASSPTTSRRNQGSRSKDTQVKVNEVKDTHNSALQQRTCTCYQCNEELIKLQSLLCSDQCSAKLCTVILDGIQRQGPVRGDNSVWILCKLQLNEKSAPHQLIVDSFPEVLLDYGKSVCGTDINEWKNLLHTLIDAVRKNQHIKENGDDYHLAVFKDVLSYLAEEIHSVNFLEILPDDGNFMFFLPYIYSCHEKDNIGKILKNIKKTGSKLRTQ
ncbi:hypothetical protein FSP39_003491 [Pinctada imbricata]|uniref:Hermansky-Pudlak syndrome 3 protein n=1 Tax=Pinctada imbricata TaxID=66713 RepID=A0AA88XKJ6_PINIB|nr:hypothetical protein FSP39_003491 [Pinctada imbricata]